MFSETWNSSFWRVLAGWLRAREILALAKARTRFLRNIGSGSSEEPSVEMRGLGQAGWRSEGATKSYGKILNFCHWSSKILILLMFWRVQKICFCWFSIVFTDVWWNLKFVILEGHWPYWFSWFSGVWLFFIFLWFLNDFDVLRCSEDVLFLIFAGLLQ